MWEQPADLWSCATVTPQCTLCVNWRWGHHLQAAWLIPPFAGCLPSALSVSLLWSFVPFCHFPRMPAGGMVEFRRSLAASFLFKGLLWASQQLEGDAPAYASPFPDSYRSGGFRC